MTLVLAVSGLAHLFVFFLLALKHPQLQMAAPPRTFDVIILPRYVRAAPAATAPRRSAIAPRPAAARARSASVAPLYVEPGQATPPAPVSAAPNVKEGVRRALRNSPVGCANADAVVLDKAERDACFEDFGRGAKTAAFIQPPMAGDKRTGFDEKVAAQERMRIYRETNNYPGLREALKAAR